MPPGLSAGKVLVGLNWVMVVGTEGVGLAQTPARNGAGCRPLADAGSLSGQPLAKLAGWLADENPVARAVGLAALNAALNSKETASENVRLGQEKAVDLIAPGTGLLVSIGRFPFLQELDREVSVIELQPREGEYDPAAAARILPGASTVIITGSALITGGVSDYMRHAPKAQWIMAGPSTPLSTGLIHAGFSALAGFEVNDADRAEKVIAEGGAVSRLSSAGRYRTLIRM